MRRLIAVGSVLALLAACGSDDPTESSDPASEATVAQTATTAPQAVTTGAPNTEAPAVSEEPVSADPIKVVATTTQLADFARVIGGDRVEVYGVLSPNADAHDFEPAPADLKAMGDAAVILRNGAELETWFDDAVAAAGGEAVVLTAADGLTLRDGEGHSDEHAEEEAGHDHAEEAGHDHGDEGEHAEEEAGHDHGEFDPHVWFDPANVKMIVASIAAAFSAADPDHADDFSANLASYQSELDELDAYIEGAIASLTNRKIVTNHEAFGYYIDRYGLEFVGSVIPSLDSAAEPSAAEIDELIEAIRAEGVTVIFTESSLPATVAEALASEAGITVVSGDDALYGDSLGPAGSPGETYLSMMRHNTDVLVKNLR
jgi:ABC-type Zn uptake system ZnuABC Zn-binding protein ZnuA